MSKRPSTKVAKEMLAHIYGKKCLLCGSKKRLQYHHILKHSMGGKVTVENGALLCESCHKHLHLSKERERYYNKKIRKIKGGEKDMTD